MFESVILLISVCLTVSLSVILTHHMYSINHSGVPFINNAIDWSLGLPVIFSFLISFLNFLSSSLLHP
jgi:F0F1-type ATP synthase membrane subunit a